MTDSAKERDEKLEDIERRVKAALPGPWGWFGNVASYQVYLATNHSGRMIVLSPETVKEEYVYSHGAERTFTLEEARAEVLELCGAHDENYGEFGGLSCRCEEVREFLRGTLEVEEGARHMFDRDGRFWSISRNMRINSVLRFQGRNQDGTPDVLMHSYSDGDMARYEVLNGKTLAEHLAGGGRRSDLYREDIVGIATPEAELIAHAPDDLKFLLDEIERLDEVIADMTT